MSEITITELYCYPVKSCRGTSLPNATVSRMGLQFDRQWMIVDWQGMFVSQRREKGLGVGIPSLCLVETSLQENSLVLKAPEMPILTVPLDGIQGTRHEVQIWKHKCEAVDQGDEAAAWFTDYLSRERPGEYRLVRMPDDGIRKTEEGDSELAFADSYPFLVISQASLDDLNSRMAQQLPMNRFRPNIVISGCDSYAEDKIAHMRIGDIEFFGMMLCIRCVITTIDQFTREQGKEPLRTLATYRRAEKGVVFGRNFNHVGVGTISMGDRVEVLAWD